MAVGTIFGLFFPNCMCEVRRECLARISTRCDRRLLYVNSPRLMLVDDSTKADVERMGAIVLPLQYCGFH